MKQPKIILGLIVCLALFLRLIFLGQIPSGFTPDEASQAYSAYSLLNTGMDEWGIAWPIASFRSFLDYKAPLQTYLMIPSIAVFGLNEFAARLPSAIFGTLAVVAIYLLTNKLFSSVIARSESDVAIYKKSSSTFNLQYSIFSKIPVSLNIGHFAAFFLAISPWHLQFSRTALEVNLASFLFPIGLYFFLEGLEKPKKLIYSAFFWGLGLYSYHAAKVFIPLFAITLLVIYWRELRDIGIRNLLTPFALAFVLAGPLLFGTVFGSAGKRGGDLLVTKLEINQLDEIHNGISYASYRTPGFTVEKIFHNKLFYSVNKVVENYVSYFTPSFWFTEGGREITYSVIPGRGLLYFWQMPLLIFAIIMLAKNNSKKTNAIIVAWLLLAAIPAAITKEGYRPNRAGSFATLFEILSALGLFHLLTSIKISKFIIALAVVPCLFLTVAYFEDYYSASQVKYPSSLSFGWREAITYIDSVQTGYDMIHIEQGSQPQSFVAFYTKVPPRDFQLATISWNKKIAKQSDIQYLDQLGDYGLGKYQFKSFSWPENQNTGTLYLSQSLRNLPKDRRVLHVVMGADGRPIMEVFDFKK